MALDVDDTPPSDVLTNNVPNGYSCRECGTPLVYSGKGRPPTLCDEHKPKAQQRQSVGRKTTSVDTLVAQITDLYLGVAVATTMFAPIDGTIIGENATKLGESWRSLIERDPKVRKFWEKALTGSGYGAVLIAHAMVAIPIMSNHNLLPNSLKDVKV